jgi:hypothetical protein
MSDKIFIVSGEGDYGTAEHFIGRATRLAVLRALLRRTKSGERWARCETESGERMSIRDLQLMSQTDFAKRLEVKEGVTP